MHETTVCLRRGAHTLYDYLEKYPPEGITYEIPAMSVTAKKKSKIQNFKRFAYTNALTLLKKPSMIYVNTDAPLIHSAGGMMILNKKPWVLGFVEHAGDFVGCGHGWLKKIKDKTYQKQIEKMLSSEYCKKVMPYSEAGKKSILNTLNCSHFAEKIEVVNLAVPLFDIPKKEKNDKVNFLFVGSMNFPENFEIKGGREMLEAFNMISDKYDTELIIRSKVPKYLESLTKNNKIKIIEDSLSWNEFQKLFYKSDVFIQPSYISSATAPLEAMSFGLPVILSDTGANSEFVQDNYNGLLSEKPGESYADDNFIPKYATFYDYVDKLRQRPYKETSLSLSEKMRFMIEHDSERRKMAQNARKMVEDGKFSIKKRNLKLKKIYNEALDNENTTD